MQARSQEVHGGTPWLLNPYRRPGAILLCVAAWLVGIFMLIVLLKTVGQYSPLAAIGTASNNDPQKFECPPGIQASNCKPSAAERDAAGAALATELAAAAVIVPFLLILWRDSRVWRSRLSAEGRTRTFSRLRPPTAQQLMVGRTRWRVRYHLEDSRGLSIMLLAPQLARLASMSEQPFTVEISAQDGKLRIYAEGDKAAAPQIAATLQHALPNAQLTPCPPTALVDLPGERREPSGARSRILVFYSARLRYRRPIGRLQRGQVVDPARRQQRFIKAKGPAKEQGRRQLLMSYLQDIEDWRERDKRDTRFQSPVSTEAGGSDPPASLFAQQKIAQMRVSFYGPATDTAGQVWQGLSVTFAGNDPHIVAALANLMGEGISFNRVTVYDQAADSPISGKRSEACRREDRAVGEFLYPPAPEFYSPEPIWRWLYVPTTIGHPEIDRVPAFRLALPDIYEMPMRQEGTACRAAGIVFGYANDLTERRRPVGVGLNNDLYRHGLVRGSTGSGKSYLLEIIAHQAAKLGMSLVALDPHGEMVRKLYNQMDAGERARTEIIDLENRPASLRLNLLAVQGADVDRAVSVAMRFFELQGLLRTVVPRRYEFCQAWLSVLLASAVNRQDSSFGVLEFMEALNDQAGCAAILLDFEDAASGGLRGDYAAFPAIEALRAARYHVNQDAQDWAENSQGVARSVSEIVGQPALAAFFRPPFTDPSLLLDNGGILLCALNEELYGSAVSKLFEVILLAIQQSVMGRGVRTGHDESRYPSTLIIIDEARHVLGDKSLKGAGPLIASMLKDFRKYHAGLILALQTLSDISNEVYDSLMENTGMKMTFQADSDKRLAALFGSTADPVWIERLRSEDHQALITFLYNGRKMLGTMTTPGRVPPMVENMAGVPQYEASGTARVWRDKSKETQRMPVPAVMPDLATQRLN